MARFDDGPEDRPKSGFIKSEGMPSVEISNPETNIEFQLDRLSEAINALHEEIDADINRLTPVLKEQQDSEGKMPGEPGTRSSFSTVQSILIDKVDGVWEAVNRLRAMRSRVDL